MSSLPLHPAMVHLPLGLAMVMPLLAAGFAWGLWTGRVRPRAWIAVVGLQALLLGAGMFAINTGKAEEERVENVIQERTLQQHEELAEQFVWSAGATLGLACLVLVFRRPAVFRTSAAVTAVATVIVAALALRVGHAGGQLVYVHGAASAYTSAGKASTSDSTAQPSTRPAGDDDDDGDRRK